MVPSSSRIGFTSFLQYSPHGEQPTSRSSKDLIRAIKNDHPYGDKPAIPYSVKRLAEELVKYPVLQECFAVTKSATAAPGQRPSPDEHYDSLAVMPKLLPSGAKIVIVDDVVTRGATFLACYFRLKQAHPDIQVVCFALVRTMRQEIDSMLAPIAGEITCLHGYPNRTP